MHSFSVIVYVNFPYSYYVYVTPTIEEDKNISQLHDIFHCKLG